jgi:hypothetical protein
MPEYRPGQSKKTVNEIIEDWNNGKTRPDLATKYQLSWQYVDRLIKKVQRGYTFLYPEDRTKLPEPIHVTVEKETTEKKLKLELSDLNKKYRSSLDRNTQLESEISALNEITKPLHTYKIEPSRSDQSEGTPVLVISDWHIDEVVTPESVSELNEFNPEIADKRITHCWQNGLSLIKMVSRDIQVDNIIVALLGDFISGNIHEELLENNSMSPIDACIFAEERIIGGIDMLLNHTKANLTIVCRPGNHSRITKRIRYATEDGNALETYLYSHIANLYSMEERVKVVSPPGYHTYIDVYDKVLRFHHGHRIRYLGGVGGITIPVNKRISEWDKGRRADLDVFGHFHQMFDGGKFICNGSLIGTTPYSLGFGYEIPKQTFFVIDKKRGKTIVAPILLDSN